jgi:hypothetical protein
MRDRVRVALVVCLVAALAGGAIAGVGTGAATSAAAVDNGGPTADGPDTLDATSAQSSVSVESVTVNRSTVAVGEAVRIEARVVNSGGEATGYEATLSVGDETVDTKTVGFVEAGFPVIVPFEYTFESAGTHTVSVGGAETEVTVEDSGSDDDGNQNDNGDTGDESNGDDGNEAGNADQFAVQNVTVDPATAGVGETVTIGFEVNNQGEERADFEVQLEIDGEVVDTKTVEAVGPRIPVPKSFEHSFNETGTYTVSVSGVEAGQQVTVEDGGGGGLFGFLGFLPLGLLRPLILFVGLPLLVVYLALKALALYLGY